MDVHDNSWMALIVRYAHYLRASTLAVEDNGRYQTERLWSLSPREPEARELDEG